MAVTQVELDRFHEFASRRIDSDGPEITFEDLVVEWESLRDRDEINAAIREGLADIEAGRHRPAEVAMEDLKRKHGLPSS